MRPDRDEMLAGVRRALTDYVAPELSASYTRTQLGFAMSLLQAIATESEDAVQLLVGENTDLRRLLRRATRRLHATSIDGPGLGDALDSAIAVRHGDLRLSSLRRENGALMEALIRLQSACEERLDDATVRGVYRSTVLFLRRRAERQVASQSPGGGVALRALVSGEGQASRAGPPR